MDFIKKYKNVILIVGVLVILFIIVKIILDNRSNIFNGLSGDYSFIYKKYGVNEYSPVDISDEQLANMYLNNFKNFLISDIDYAYGLIDEEYRNIKFGSIDGFKDYVSNINYTNLSVKEYSISNVKNFIEVHTMDDRVFIFRINSVLDYSVYLDNYTVDILA